MNNNQYNPFGNNSAPNPGNRQAPPQNGGYGAPNGRGAGNNNGQYGGAPNNNNAGGFNQNPGNRYNPGNVPPNQYYNQNYNNYGNYAPPVQNRYNTPYMQNPELMRQQMMAQEKIRQQKKEIRLFGNIVGLTIVAYIVLQLISGSLIQMLGLYDLYMNNSIFYNTFNLLAVSVISVTVPFGVMALISKKRYTHPVVPTEKIKFKNLCLWIAFGMGCCIASNYIVSAIIMLFKSFGYELSTGSSPDPDSVFACVICVIATAVVPAICEEFAMRCCSLQLLRKYGKAFGVVAVSLVFGLLHGNVVQFVFASLVGLILAFITVKTDSILPAVFIHGFNNGISVTQSILKYASGESVSNTAIVVIYILWGAAGIIAAIYMGIKGYFNSGKQKPAQPQFIPGQDPRGLPYIEPTLSTGKKLAVFFFVPGMIFPFIYLVLTTVSTIVPIK